MMQTTCPQTYNYTQAAPSTNAVNSPVFEPAGAYAGQSQPPVTNPIYSYPLQSVYTQPYQNQYQQYIPGQYQQAAPSASAVNIQIFEPKAYSGQPQQQAPAYIPQNINSYYQQPVQQVPYVQQVSTQPVPQQPMPAPVIAQEQQTPTTAQETQAPAQQTASTPEMTVTEPQPQQPPVDTDALIAGLQSTDNATQEAAITKIANLSQGDPSMQNAVLSEPIMNGLANIIAQDTSNLQGPTEAQIAAMNKAAAGTTLTPEEEALTKELAPKTAADKNKAIAMFTLAMLQKNQRDEIDRYNQTQDTANQLPQIKATDLIGYKQIENAARSTNPADKEVKLAALQALSYAARPEDKDTLTPIATAAAQDSEPLIKQAADDLSSALGIQSAPAQDANIAEADSSKKLSRKERKAAEKAAKQA